MADARRLLVVGGGSIGERHVRCLRRTGRAVVGLCDVRPEVRQAAAAGWGVEAVFESLREALRQPWDAAVIATPAHTHVPIAMQAAEAGLALLIEKPLAVEVEGLAALQALVRARRLPVAVGYVFRAHPGLRAVRDAIASGRFGAVLQLVAVAGQHFPTYRPAYRDTYYAHHASGGGAIQDALTHLLNAGEWLAGPITRVAADAAHLAIPGVTVEDTVAALVRHGRVLATYSLNQHQAPNEATLTAVCERGTLRFELHRHRWRWMSQPDTPWHDEQIAFRDRDDWFVEQERAWLDTLAGVAPPLCSLDEGIQTLRATRAVLESVRRQGAAVDVAAVEPESEGVPAAGVRHVNGHSRLEHVLAASPLPWTAASSKAGNGGLHGER